MNETGFVICFADDDEVLRDTMVDILALEGYSVLAANDGIEALAQMREQTPHLILADLTMPRMNGMALFHEVRAVEEWRDIPYIILTARLQVEAAQVLESGVDAYMTKPFDLDDILALVQRYLGEE